MVRKPGTISGEPATTVVWKVEGAAKKAGATISTTELLTVAKDETAETLTVITTSMADDSKSGTATAPEASVTSITERPDRRPSRSNQR
jgi:hypothetical protein